MDGMFNKLVAVAAVIDIPAKDVADGEYFGSAKRYAVIQMRSEPTFHGDDTPLVDRYSFYFDIYVPMHEAYRKWVHKVQIALEDAGMDAVSYQGQELDSNTKTRCVMFDGTFDIPREE